MEIGLELLDYVNRNWPTEITSRNYTERPKFAKRHGVAFDTRTRLTVIEDLRRRGIDSVPATGAFFLNGQPGDLPAWEVASSGGEPFPLSGIANKTTVLCNENGSWTIYQSDEHGFHNPAGLWNEHSDHLLKLRGHIEKLQTTFTADIDGRGVDPRCVSNRGPHHAG